MSIVLAASLFFSPFRSVKESQGGEAKTKKREREVGKTMMACGGGKASYKSNNWKKRKKQEKEKNPPKKVVNNKLEGRIKRVKDVGKYLDLEVAV